MLAIINYTLILPTIDRTITYYYVTEDDMHVLLSVC